MLNTDWATLLFVICFGLLAINKAVFGTRFSEFLKLGFSDKFVKIYKDSSNIRSWFTVSMFVIQVISFSFISQLGLAELGITTKDNPISFIRIITVITFFILSKYLIEQIIATTFNIEEFEQQFNLFKVYYRTYLGLLVFPFGLILYYNNFTTLTIIITLIAIVLLINLFTYLNCLRIYKKFILSNIFYFILYLCALEIAPYYFMYYFFTKS